MQKNRTRKSVFASGLYWPIRLWAEVTPRENDTARNRTLREAGAYHLARLPLMAVTASGLGIVGEMAQESSSVASVAANVGFVICVGLSAIDYALACNALNIAHINEDEGACDFALWEQRQAAGFIADPGQRS